MIQFLKRIFPYRILFPLLIIDIIASFLLVIITNFSALDSIQTSVNDFDFTDFAFQKTGSINDIVDSTIILVNIGHAERDQIGHIINNINKYNPKVIGLDVRFPNLKIPIKDAVLIDGINKVDNLVMATGVSWTKGYRIDSIQYSHESFIENADQGFSNWLLSNKRGFSNPWSIRKFTNYGDYNGNRYYPFALELLKNYDPSAFTKYISQVPFEVIINYSGNMNNFLTFDVHEAFNDTTNLEIVRNKIVILGYLGDDLTRPDFEKMLYTPVSYLDYDKNLTNMYSSVIHANVISMILKGKLKQEVNFIINTFLEILILYLFVYLCDYFFRSNENNYPLYSISSSFLLINFLILFTIFSFQYVNLKFAFGNAILYLVLIPDSFEIYKKNIENYIQKIKLKKWIILVSLIALDLLLSYLVVIINNNSLSISNLFL